jgi:hypothetical protein
MSNDMVMMLPISFGLLAALALVSGATLGLVNFSNMGSWIVFLMGGTGVLTVIALWAMLADESGNGWRPERIHTHTERTIVHVVNPADFRNREWLEERRRT